MNYKARWEDDEDDGYGPVARPSAILPGQLWQGGLIRRGNNLRSLGITAVINMDQVSDVHLGREIPVLHYAIDDGSLPRNLNELRRVRDWGVAVLRDGGKLLVHCAAGWNRSSLCTGLILTDYLGITGVKAVALIRKRRANTLGNRTFRSYLENVERDPEGIEARAVRPFVFIPRAPAFTQTQVVEDETVLAGWDAWLADENWPAEGAIERPKNKRERKSLRSKITNLIG